MKRDMQRSRRLTHDVGEAFSAGRIALRMLRNLLRTEEIVYVFEVNPSRERILDQRKGRHPLRRPLNRDAMEFIEALERDTVLVFHGEGSDAVAGRYRSRGFANVYVLEGMHRV